MTYDYTVMRFAVMHDVRLIIGNNGGRIRQLVQMVEDNVYDIIKDIRDGTICSRFPISGQELDRLAPYLVPNPDMAAKLELETEKKGRLTPDIYWPNMKVINCWLSGPIGRYKEWATALFPHASLMDVGYGASEGKFNIPVEPDNPAAPLAVFGIFFEFSRPYDSSNMLLAHELEDGELYEMYITTWSGLYRYAIHDLVRVKGFTGSTPNIMFESKTGDVANLCGEKTSPVILGRAVDAMHEKLGINVIHWCVVTDMVNKRYVFCIETENAENDRKMIRDMAACIEEELSYNGILPYPLFRKQDFIQPASVAIMKKGWHDAWFSSMIKDGKASNQIKLPVVCKEIPLPDYIDCRM